MAQVVYECGICGCYHPWEFDGDCREDSNRFATPEDYMEARGISEFNTDGNLQLEVRSMDERLEADNEAL